MDICFLDPFKDIISIGKPCVGCFWQAANLTVTEMQLLGARISAQWWQSAVETLFLEDIQSCIDYYFCENRIVRWFSFRPCAEWIGFVCECMHIRCAKQCTVAPSAAQIRPTAWKREATSWFRSRLDIHRHLFSNQSANSQRPTNTKWPRLILSVVIGVLRKEYDIRWRINIWRSIFRKYMHLICILQQQLSENTVATCYKEKPKFYLYIVNLITVAFSTHEK